MTDRRGKEPVVMIRTCAIFFLAVAVLMASGCGKPPPPKELNNARDAYAQASKGEPAELAPAQLDDARRALEAAEQSFDKKKDKPITVDLAYLAWRRVQIAQSTAELEKATRQLDTAEKELSRLRGEMLSNTQKELQAAERQTEKLAEEKQKTEAELERERKAREAAEKKLSAALASLQQVASVKEEKRGVVITLSGSVLFATGKHELLPIAMSKLDEVVKALQDQGYKKIIVEGHTDSIGSDSNNRSLSQRRADSVRSYIVSRGIESSKVESIGYGEARPVADNSTPEGRANNRRVELVVTPE